MKVLVIEDNDEKRDAIVKHLHASGVRPSDILLADCIPEFTAHLQQDIDLFIIDIRIPSYKGGTETENGRTIIESIVKSGKSGAQLIAISAYPDEFKILRQYFEAHGCILSDFASDSWKSTLNHLLVQAKKNTKMDFLIFCALEEEMRPYYALSNNGQKTTRGSFTSFDFSISGKVGAAILLPRMGLVNAAAIAAVCVDRYKPSIVAMSGICGGFKGRVALGQLLISEMVYEYQSGKWTVDGFSQDPYQVSTSVTTLAALRHLIGDENFLSSLESGFRGYRPTAQNSPSLAIFTSGSAVIADPKFMTQVGEIHRKVGGLDMEIFGIKRAVQILGYNPHYVCAKVVVDLCDDDKDDKLHEYGALISAKFVLAAIEHLLAANPQ
ncbi:5'-methylthioadenosine/S-adenosylhomocysteine nucleosidase [Achromobacter deleyi]|uniref:5'-methylthioadenosine/S-adenosylhomocysteine nucleosidase n=1 Tax=Achromobacter deleyi TaxID=1353891 RepID=A0A6S7BSW1_9BURK|nr:nucleoside phosphorylase [Achromobacter deleyi]CAB3727244.1 5'-methylthioadenosine/S-adenosylhomocysteine nucleosidase [Achromobacter deleyi]